VTVWVGTSGWQYDSWRGVLYPAGLPQRKWLEHYAARFQVVEVNNTFYHLPERRTFEGWAERTPPDFVFALKLSRYLSHIKRLREPEEPVKRFLDRAAPLEGRAGPLLLQLPPDFHADPGRLTAVLDCIPRALRVAVEFRHASWFTEEVRSVLEQRGAALCLPDRRSRLQAPLWRTADWGYVRLHEGRARPQPSYGADALAAWVERIARLWPDGSDVYVFFNNDPNGCAVRNASMFASLVERSGRRVSRTAADWASGGAA
jgi:uncharacterized protein YecE (DUF72 family)